MDVVTEHPCDVVPVGALDHLLQAQGLLVDVLDLRSWVGPAQGGVGLLDGVLCDGVDPVIVKGKELVEVTAHHLHQIIVADTRPCAHRCCAREVRLLHTRYQYFSRSPL